VIISQEEEWEIRLGVNPLKWMNAIGTFFGGCVSYGSYRSKILIFF
jgi:hypothetical protein